jgi:hypothetical protein
MPPQVSNQPQSRKDYSAHSYQQKRMHTMSVKQEKCTPTYRGENSDSHQRMAPVPDKR